MPVVAPEIEFYLVQPNKDPDYPLQPPAGRSGRPESARQSYSIAAVNEFDDLFDDIYHFSEAQDLEIDTLIHEEGAAQMEINLRHGHPLVLADQVFQFKRTIREAALRHEMYATFMAKPMSSEPGSAMHIHQSVNDIATGREHLLRRGRRPDPRVLLLHRRLAEISAGGDLHAGALRQLVPAAGALGVGSGQHHVGLRQPHGRAARADLLARGTPGREPHPVVGRQPLSRHRRLARLGYLGMVEGLACSDPVNDGANDDEIVLPRGLLEAVALFEDCDELVEIFGKGFVSTYRAIKQAEFETFMQVISPWEREYLLLNV